MVKGKKDYRDLTSIGQYFYEKLVGFINQWPINEDVISAIDWLDNIIDEVKKDITNYYESKLEDINQILDKANAWIDDLEEKIEEL